ncbi:MAG: response regulator transcription factor [SAR86 cluster bacterium]|uniref:Response regulator transcription factor n=1 Tax=SAR86 cluster bacterium TaxID=2030880 RepID=A0A973A861_9GAMM|nr:response regulator transcription factor [SAR86 cluster bacterium]
MATQKQTILVVEDDEMVQAFLVLHLENEGFGVCTASTGAEMIQSLSVAMPDLILLDLNLPDGDGLSLATQVRQNSKTPIIIATTRKSREDRLMGLGIGADDYITKPFDPKELVLRVHNILARTLPDEASPPSRHAKLGEKMKISSALLPYPISEMAPPTTSKPGWRQGGIFVTSLLAIAGATAYWLLGTPVPVQTAMPQAGAYTLEKPTAQIRKPSPRFIPVPVQMKPEPVKALDQLSTAAGPQNMDDEFRVQPLAEILGYGWVLNSKCDTIPQVKWWKFKTPESIASYVNRRHEGDWAKYSKIWLRRLAKLQEIFERDSSAVTRTGIVLKGEALGAYLGQMQKRIVVIHCLAGEAKRHAEITQAAS